MVAKLRLLVEQNQKIQEAVTQEIVRADKKLAATETLRLLLVRVDSPCFGGKIRRRNIVIGTKRNRNAKDEPLYISHPFSVSSAPRECNLPDPFKIVGLYVPAHSGHMRLMSPAKSLEDMDLSALEKIFPPFPKASTCDKEIGVHKSLSSHRENIEAFFPNSTKGRVHIRFHSSDPGQQKALEVMEQFKRSFEGEVGRRILQQNWPDPYTCLARLLVNYLYEEFCRHYHQDRLKFLAQNYLLTRWSYLQHLVERATYPLMFACEDADFLRSSRVRAYRKLRGSSYSSCKKPSFILAALIAHRAGLFRSSTFLDPSMSLSLFVGSSELIDFRVLLNLKLSEFFKEYSNAQ